MIQFFSSVRVCVWGCDVDSWYCTLSLCKQKVFCLFHHVSPLIWFWHALVLRGQDQLCGCLDLWHCQAGNIFSAKTGISSWNSHQQPTLGFAASACQHRFGFCASQSDWILERSCLDDLDHFSIVFGTRNRNKNLGFRHILTGNPILVANFQPWWDSAKALRSCGGTSKTSALAEAKSSNTTPTVQKLCFELGRHTLQRLNGAKSLFNSKRWH